MPTVRHAKPRNRYGELSEYQLAYLLDRELPEPTSDNFWWETTEANAADHGDSAWEARCARTLWLAHEATLLPTFVADHPGYRPSCWCRYSAPRQPVGR